jgi:alpha-1,2-mannosyltransferase
MPELSCKVVPTSLAWLAGSVIACAVAFSFLGTVGKPDCMDLDFGSYYRAANAVAHGQSPYFVDEHGPLGTYPYAPVFPYLLIPLTKLDYLWACRAWLVFNWLTLAACCLLALRLLEIDEDSHRRRWRILALALVPTAAYMWYTLRVGQVSLLMLLGCLAWAGCRRSGWRFLGGLFLAAACALKLSPGVFVMYLLVRRDVRGLAGLATGAMLLFITPAVWGGADGAVLLHGEWIRHIAQTQIPEQTYRPGNQSLLGQLARLPAISNGHQCYSEENLDFLCAMYPVVVLAAVAVGWAGMARLRQAGDYRQETVELALLFVFLTLAQPRGWRCNFVAMLLPCLLLAKQVLNHGEHWPFAALGLACMTVACAVPTNGLNEDGWNWLGWVLLGKHFWGAAAVGAATWLYLNHPPNYASCRVSD